MSEMEIWLNDKEEREKKRLQKTFPSTNLSTTDPTCTDVGLNPCHCREKPTTNNLI
jgi:hypothetical protein